MQMRTVTLVLLNLRLLLLFEFVLDQHYPCGNYFPASMPFGAEERSQTDTFFMLEVAHYFLMYCPSVMHYAFWYWLAFGSRKENVGPTSIEIDLSSEDYRRRNTSTACSF